MSDTDRSADTENGAQTARRNYHGLTRRGLLIRAGATSIAALGTPALFAACANPPAAPVASATAAVSKRAGGRITWAVSADAGTTNDPQLTGANTAWAYQFRVFEQLVGLDASGKNLVPNIATSWTQPNPTSWVFKLRDDVKFSNGRRLQASDVAKSFQRLLDPKIYAALGTSYSGALKEARVIDDLTVQIDLKQAYGPFLASLGAAPLSVLPMQELEAGTYVPSKDLLGSGPFMFKEQLPGESWTFARNPHYWRTGLPDSDELVMLIVPDESARLAALRSGRADVATFDSVDSPRLLADIPNVKVAVVTTPEFYVLILNSKTPTTAALKDQRVRQALSLAIDRDQIIQVALGGRAKPAFGTVPGLPDDIDASRLPKRDINRAKALLTAAGATGLSIEIMTSPIIAQASAIAQVLQRNLADAGVTVRLQELEAGVWRTRLNTEAKFDGTVSFYTGQSDNWISLNNWNPAGTVRDKYIEQIPALNSLLDTTVSMQPGRDRATKFQQMAEIIGDSANSIPLTTRFHVVAHRSDRVDVKTHEFEPYGNFARFIAEYNRRV